MGSWGLGGLRFVQQHRAPGDTRGPKPCGDSKSRTAGVAPGPLVYRNIKELHLRKECYMLSKLRKELEEVKAVVVHDDRVGYHWRNITPDFASKLLDCAAALRCHDADVVWSETNCGSPQAGLCAACTALKALGEGGDEN